MSGHVYVQFVTVKTFSMISAMSVVEHLEVISHSEVTGLSHISWTIKPQYQGDHYLVHINTPLRADHVEFLEILPGVCEIRAINVEEREHMFIYFDPQDKDEFIILEHPEFSNDAPTLDEFLDMIEYSLPEFLEDIQEHTTIHFADLKLSVDENNILTKQALRDIENAPPTKEQLEAVGIGTDEKEDDAE